MDREAQPSPDNAVEPERSRSLFGQVAKWSLVTALLVVMAIEAHAVIGHDRSFNRLRTDLETAAKSGATLNLAEARLKVSGLTFQTDKRVDGQGRLTFRWPSLFKTYVLNLLVGAGEVVMMVDAQTGDPDKVDPETFAAGQPKHGFPSPLQGTVALTTEDVRAWGGRDNYDPATLKVAQGALVRELVRQAFLLAAHEELRQNVHDESLGEDVGSDDNPQDFPYEVRTEIRPTGQLNLRVTKYFVDKPPTRRELAPHQLDTDRFYESLLAHVEELSRTAFPDFLRETGASGTANTFRETAEVPQDIAGRLHKIDEMSQLTAARELHALIRNDGESPERLAALARAYANLGSLTDNHWQFHHKVFKARALLYAQRSVAATKSSPWAVAHRGYAWALTGRLNSASEDFQQASAAQVAAGDEAKFPRWITDARAYCNYEPDRLQSSGGDEKALVAYLRLLLADPIEGKTEYLKAAQTFIAASPGCARATLAMGEVQELGIRRKVAEGDLQSAWPAIYQTLNSAADLPAEATALIVKHARDAQVRRDEPQDRVRLIQMLKSAPDTGSGPNPSVYGRLVGEISFLHAEYRIGVEQNWLGLPPDKTVKEVAPTLAGHPYAAYLLSKGSDPSRSRAKFQEFLKTLKPTELDVNAHPVLDDTHRMDPQAFAELWYREVSHHDVIQPDVIRELQYDIEYRRDKLLLHYLSIVAPQLPQSIAQRIAANGLKDTGEAQQLEVRYDRNPSVLEAIANWHSGRGEYDDALRCLKRRVEIAPESKAYRSLAEVYAKKNDRVQWKATLLAALKLPSLGLDHAGIQQELAYYHMHRNELKAALPYAEAAAGTGLAAGLQCAARCYERMGRLGQTESLLKGCSERYENMSFEWLFWCLRTGQGDEPSARRLAEAVLEKHRQAAAYDQVELAIYHLTENDTAAALTIFSNAASRTGYSYLRLHAALLADVTGNVEARDGHLRMMSGSRNLDPIHAELADLIRGFLAQPEPSRWNKEEFWRILSKCYGGEVTNFYYVAGRFLELHGQLEQGTEYLKLAASSSASHKHSCLLATMKLRELGIEIPAIRPFEFGGELEDLTLVKDELNACWTARQHDRIVELITQGLADHPQWAFLLVDRGLAYEQLGKNQEAIADYERAVEQMPNYQPAHHELAMIRGACEDAALRDPAQALIHAQKGFDLAFTKTYLDHTCLAIAFAANGDFAKAVEYQKLALQNWPDKLMSIGQERLQLFQEQKPYVREPQSP